jgi:hypothetical protein
LFVWQILASSCSNRGCTDAAADNYEPKAKTDCECCQFSGKAVAWYKQPFYNYMKSIGVSSFKFKCNGEVVGTGTFLWYYNDNPPTFATNKSDYSYFRKDDGKTAVVTIGNVKNAAVQLSCVDQNGTQFWNGTVNVTANTLTAFEMR